MDTETVRARLEEERRRLQAVKDSLIAEGMDEREDDNLSELSTVDQHPGDVGTETFERERDLSVLERVESELEDIDLALGRIEDGSYGTCEDCGAPIPDARLDALPFARRCVEHQAARERAAG